MDSLRIVGDIWEGNGHTFTKKSIPTISTKRSGSEFDSLAGCIRTIATIAPPAITIANTTAATSFVCAELTSSHSDMHAYTNRLNRAGI